MVTCGFKITMFCHSLLYKFCGLLALQHGQQSLCLICGQGNGLEGFENEVEVHFTSHFDIL